MGIHALALGAVLGIALTGVTTAAAPVTALQVSSAPSGVTSETGSALPAQVALDTIAGDHVHLLPSVRDQLPRPPGMGEPDERGPRQEEGDRSRVGPRQVAGDQLQVALKAAVPAQRPEDLR